MNGENNMNTGNILQPTVIIKQSLLSKILCLLSSWFLAEFVLISGVLDFIERLNEKGILGMGEGFSTYDLFWGDGLWMNLFRLIIFVFFAGLFGLIYGYLSKKVTISEKIIVNTINAFLSLFGYVFILLFVLAILKPGSAWQINSGISLMLHAIVSSPFSIIFVILNLVCSFTLGFYCVGIGTKISNNPYHTLDKNKTGTLLGIKWYHYAWLWLPIGFYAQTAVKLIYATGHAILTLFTNFRWFELFGGTVSSENGTTQNSLEVVWGKLLILYIGAALLYYLLVYLREVLAGEKQMHWALKILISIGIGFVLPFVLIVYTVLGR